METSCKIERVPTRKHIMVEQMHFKGRGANIPGGARYTKLNNNSENFRRDKVVSRAW